MSKLLNKQAFGFLIMRVVIGTIFMVAGLGKFLGGRATLEAIGRSAEVFGIGFAPLMWGVLAALIETVAGFLILVGFLFRGAAFGLFAVMVVAVAVEYSAGSQFVSGLGYPLMMAAITAGFIFTGPGKIAIQKDLGS